MYDSKGSDLLDYEESDFDTIIAPDISFTGKIRFAKPFLIQGKVSGTISAQSDLVVDSGARVDADIQADRVLVRGTVNGNVSGRSLIFVTSTGSINGDISSAQVVLEQGGIFSGKCSMSGKADE